MSKPKNEELMFQIQELYGDKLSDGKIAKILGTRVNIVHHYRYYVMRLPAHQTKRVYSDQQSKLKGYIIRGIKSSAKRRGLDFTIDASDLVLPTHCPLLNTELSYKCFLGKSDFNANNFATVDRKDSSKGYVKGNIWIISRLANNMKSCASKDELKLFATNVLKEYDIV